MSKSELERVPRCGSVSELGDHLDQVDANELMTPERSVSFDVDLREQANLVRIEASLMRRLRRAARASGVSAETLANLWLEERAKTQEA